MIDFFLLNDTIDIDSHIEFKKGILKLNSINHNEEHRFNKCSSIYNLTNYELLFSNYSYEEQVIIKYLEQLNTIEDDINTEALADSFCESDVNGFTGIDFTKSSVLSEVKKIKNEETYQNWINFHSTNFELLNGIVENFNFHFRFQKDFNKLSFEAQNSIINLFGKAKNRNLATPFYSDNKIVKDVTPSNGNCTVLELRVYNPIALRVYFNESGGRVNVCSIEQKSNSNQSIDINKAHDYLKKM